MDSEIALCDLTQIREYHVNRTRDGAQQEESAHTGQEKDDDRNDDGRRDDALIDGSTVVVCLTRTGDAAIPVFGDQLGKILVFFQCGAVEVGECLVVLSLGEHRIDLAVRGAVCRPCLALVLQDGTVFRCSVRCRVDDVGECLFVLDEGVVRLLFQCCQCIVDLCALCGILCHGANDGNPSLCAGCVCDIRYGRQIVRPAHEIHHGFVQFLSRVAGECAEAEEHHNEQGKTQNDLL